jgi:hypothetical protein
MKKTLVLATRNKGKENKKPQSKNKKIVFKIKSIG